MDDLVANKNSAERSFLRFYKELQMYYKRVNGDRNLHSNQDLREQVMSDLATVEQQAAQPPIPAISESGASNFTFPASGSERPPSSLVPPGFPPYVESKNET